VAIDGVDIASVPLRDLRSRVAIIPQEATLLVGTVQSNLDPLDQHSAAEMVGALEHVGVVGQLTGRLGQPGDGAESDSDGGAYDGVESAAGARILRLRVAEGGENFSAGTRQLICVARALLRRCKVVVMDEASSAMDAATDAALQRTMRTEFSGCTVLTIAHRLHTIIDSDAVVVMERGRVREHGPPAELLETPGSEFASLVRESRRAVAEP